MDSSQKNTFYLIGGPIAAGKSTLMDAKLYNTDPKPVNFFDHDREKLMVQLYALDQQDKPKVLGVGKALSNAIYDSLHNRKDFIIQVHFLTEQQPKINTYFHKYGNSFSMKSHFITVDNVDTLKHRAEKRENLGGHSSEIKSIDKTYEQSFRNFVKYIPQLDRATLWDNSEEYGFNKMKPQFVFEKGKLVYQNPDITEYAARLLAMAKASLNNEKKHSQNRGFSL